MQSPSLFTRVLQPEQRLELELKLEHLLSVTKLNFKPAYLRKNVTKVELELVLAICSHKKALYLDNYQVGEKSWSSRCSSRQSLTRESPGSMSAQNLALSLRHAAYR
jgi:hypothetical protein